MKFRVFLRSSMTGLTSGQKADVTKEINEAVAKLEDKFNEEVRLGRIKSLELTELRKAVTQLEQQVGDLEKKVKVLEGKGVGQGQTDSADLWSKLKVSPAVRLDITNIIVKECSNTQKKEKNVIMHGVEKGDEKRKLTEIIEILQVDAGEFKSTRFKDSGEKTGLLLVEFEDVETKMNVLKASRKLKGSKYDKVFINKDLTEAEMVREKDLRKRRIAENLKLEHGDGHFKYGMHKFGSDNVESKYYWGVRDGELRKIKKQ